MRWSFIFLFLIYGCGEDNENKFCEGEPLPCSSFSDLESCQRQEGCRWGPGCMGKATSCEMLQEKSGIECISQMGCKWIDVCKGSAKSCSLFSSKYSCEDQKGCMWSDTLESCSGLANDCSLLNKHDCISQDGCYLEGYCEGQEKSCEELSLNPDSFYQHLCEKQKGCSWVSEKCSGSPRECVFLSPSECKIQAGCFLTSKRE